MAVNENINLQNELQLLLKKCIKLSLYSVNYLNVITCNIWLLVKNKIQLCTFLRGHYAIFKLDLKLENFCIK